MHNSPPQPGFHTHDRFMRLYSHHYLRLHAYIATFLYRPADVDDALQETSVVLWEKFTEFQPASEQTATEEFGRWSAAIARYKVLHAMRSHGRGSVPLDESLIDAISDKQLALADELADRRLALSECLAKLPPADRSLIDTCYRGDKQFKDVAEEIGRPINSVYKSLGRIRAVLMRCIDLSRNPEARA